MSYVWVKIEDFQAIHYRSSISYNCVEIHELAPNLMQREWHNHFFLSTISVNREVHQDTETLVYWTLTNILKTKVIKSIDWQSLHGEPHSLVY